MGLSERESRALLMPLVGRLSIRKALLGGFLLVVLMMMWLACWGRLAVRDTRRALHSLRENELVLAQHITAVNAAIRGWGLPTVEHVLETRPDQMERYEREMNERWAAAAQELEQLSQLPQLPARAQDVLERIHEVLQGAGQTHTEVVRLSAAGRKSEAAQLFRERLKPALDSLEQQMGKFREVRQSQLTAAVAAAEEHVTTHAAHMSWMAGAAVLLTGLLILLMVRRISKGVTEVVAAAEAVARDVLERDMSPVPTADEVGYVKNALAALRLALETSLAERVAVREQVSKLEADLAHAARVSTLGEMASGLAHELTQPLTAIAGYTQACLERLGEEFEGPEHLAPLLEKTVSQTRRAGAIIERMRGFVRRQPPPREALDLGELVRESLTFMEHELRRRGVPVDVVGCETPLYALGGRVELEQVIVNLVRNALEAMEGVAQPALTIRGFPLAGKVGLAVVDRGPGLAPGVAEKVFEPFFTTKAGGMGMGLAICRSIIEAHGGRLTVSSNPQGGAVFTFTLQAYDECPVDVE